MSDITGQTWVDVVIQEAACLDGPGMPNNRRVAALHTCSQTEV
jgi:hypothetical protein